MGHTAAFLLLKSKGSILVRIVALRRKAVGHYLLEVCIAADTREVGAAHVSGIRR